MKIVLLCLVLILAPVSTNVVMAEESQHYSETVRRIGSEYRMFVANTTYNILYRTKVSATAVQTGLKIAHKIGSDSNDWSNWLLQINHYLSNFYWLLLQQDGWDSNLNILTQQGMEYALSMYVEKNVRIEEI